jgi:hypothetical protein
MNIVTKVANILLIVFSIYFAMRVTNSMQIEDLRMRTIVDSESYSCDSFIVFEIRLAVFIAALINRGNRLMKTGVI